MRIISKHKDYYDYLQGVYGIDNNKVYKREDYIICGDFISYWNSDHTVHCFAINNKLYTICQNKKGFYTDDKLKIQNSNPFLRRTILLKTPTVNIERRKPIVYGRLWGNSINWVKGDPIMKSFDFHKVLSAEQLYIEVETFLGYLKDHPEIPNNQSDIEKLLSHGFDKKKSFRHRK